MDVQIARMIQNRLLGDWADARAKRRPAGVTFEASLDAVEQALPPPPGLAVGYAADPDGRVRIGVRAAVGRAGMRTARRLVADLVEEGIPVDFRAIPRPTIPVGTLDAGGAFSPHFSSHCRPLHIGASISHESGPAGTIGGIVRLPGDSLGVLSCSHVLALGGDAKVGDYVCQPAQQDQAIALAENRIGKLSGKFAPLIAGKPNNLDAAIAFLDDPRAAADGNHIPDFDLPGPNAIPAALRGRPIGAVRAISALARGTRVGKIGRSSGYTEGALTLAALTNFTPDIQRKGIWGTYPFPDVIEITSLSPNVPFARGGDSGAMVFTLPELCPIGIHFCSVPLQGEPSLNYLMPLDRICAMFSVSLLGSAVAGAGPPQ